MAMQISNVGEVKPPDQMLLYVFSPSKEERLYQLQMDTLSDRQLALNDHDVVIAEVFENEDGHIGVDELPCDRCRGLRQQFHIMPGQFKVMLVDKDSAVKLCAESCVSCEEVFLRVEKEHTVEV
ncbi:MAG: DUF4174 domain-containing protein [Phycisphaerae bacterium]|nr:DUF4174 domain-containing protein [Phycisphaerae bacterium]